MIGALALTFGQLLRGELRWVVLVCWAGTACGLALIATAAELLFSRFQFLDLAWLDLIAHLIGGALLVAGLVLLYPAAVVLISGLFAETVMEAVERRHYPGLPPLRPYGVGEAILDALRFAGKVLLLNLLAIPFYLIPMLNVIAFVLVNAYILGREYFEMVASRRLGPVQVREVRRAHRTELVFAGATILMLMMVPGLGLLMPVVGSAFMVHVFHRLDATPAALAVAGSGRSSRPWHSRP